LDEKIADFPFSNVKFNNNKFFNPGEKTLEDKFPVRGIHDLIHAARNARRGMGTLGI